MAIRKIVLDGDPILRKVCRTVESFDDRLAKLLDDMRETLHYENGAGLAAPQVGILKRAAIVEVGPTYLEMINPVIIARSGEQVGPEGCLSVPGEGCYVSRPMHVTVRYTDRLGKEREAKVSALAARAVCHELDHLDGVLYYDKEYKGKIED